jgi:Flp pilus assembly protein TadG
MNVAEQTTHENRRRLQRRFSWRWIAVRFRTAQEPRRGVFDESGTALVEFAIASSVLLMLMFGIIELCFALYTYNYVSDAARVATRYAVVRGSSCTALPDCGITAGELQNYVRGIGYPGINPRKLTVRTTWLSFNPGPPTTWDACAGQCNEPSNAVKIQVSYDFPLFLPFWRSTSLQLTSTSQMVISN